MYVEDVNFLLKLYATDPNIAKETFEVAAPRQTTMETSIHYADVLCTKEVCCENAYPVKRTNGVFMDSLLANNKIVVRLFYDCKKGAPLSEASQYVHTLLEQTRQVASSVATQNR